MPHALDPSRMVTAATATAAARPDRERAERLPAWQAATLAGVLASATWVGIGAAAAWLLG